MVTDTTKRVADIRRSRESDRSPFPDGERPLIRHAWDHRPPSTHL